MYDHAAMNKPVDWRRYIVATPGMVGGKPRVIDTRLSVELLLGLFAAGWTREEVTEEYDLTVDQIQSVFAYAAEILGEGIFYPTPAATGLMRILLDENVSKAAARMLAPDQHDVRRVARSIGGKGDDEVLALARAEQRLLVTF
jgi:uncharacterized protein (DUF433 family)